MTASQINDTFGFQSGVKVKVVGEETSSHKINIEKVTSSKTFFGFLYSILKSLKEREAKYLIVSK